MPASLVSKAPPDLTSGGRTARFSAMARRPRTRAAEGLLAGPSRGAVAAGRCTPASYAERARRRACAARGGRGLAGTS